MQSETLYGARASAALKGFILISFAILLMVTRDGEVGGIRPWIAVGALIFGLWEARGAFKPKELILDRYGLVYHPALSGAATSIKWHSIKSFAVKGGNKNRKLVCEYLDENNGQIKTLQLGEGWSADGKDLFADRLENVHAHLEEARKRYQMNTPSAPESKQRPLVDMAKKPVPQPKLQVASASVKSGQVYAKQDGAIKAPPINLSRIPNEGTSKIVGGSLLIAAAGIGVASAFAYRETCKNGLCEQGLWVVPDPSLWIFFIIWSVCLLMAVVGLKKINS